MRNAFQKFWKAKYNFFFKPQWDFQSFWVALPFLRVAVSIRPCRFPSNFLLCCESRSSTFSEEEQKLHFHKSSQMRPVAWAWNIPLWTETFRQRYLMCRVGSCQTMIKSCQSSNWPIKAQDRSFWQNAVARVKYVGPSEPIVGPLRIQIKPHLEPRSFSPEFLGPWTKPDCAI